MTPLRQRMSEGHAIAQLRDHHQALQPRPQELDLEAVRQRQLHLAQERKLSPESINTFVSAV